MPGLYNRRSRLCSCSCATYFPGFCHARAGVTQFAPSQPARAVPALCAAPNFAVRLGCTRMNLQRAGTARCIGRGAAPRLTQYLVIARAQAGVTYRTDQYAQALDQEFAGNPEQQQSARRTAYRIRLRDLVQPPSTSTERSGERSVKFHVRYKTDFGQTVYLLGNVDALGQWQVERAVELAWSEGHLWQGAIPIPEGTRMEYKYVIKNSDGSVARWQEGDNVVLELPPSARSIAMEVEDAWNQEKQVKRILAAGTPVKFNLQKQCAFGQQVVVVGSCAPLGSWDVGKGLRLKWTEGHVWEASLEMGSGETVEYKYVLVGEDGSTEWQEGDNLVMEVPSVAPTANGRRRGVLVLDSWLRAPPRPRPQQAQLEAQAASAAEQGAASSSSSAAVDPIHMHQQAPRFGGRAGSSWGDSAQGPSSSGRPGSSSNSNYDALMERLQAIMANQTTPSPRARKTTPSSSSKGGARQQQQPQVPPVPEPVMSLWTEGPRFAGRASAPGVSQWQHSLGTGGALQPPAGVDLEDPVELGRWQALNSVMLALQHSSELSHWCDDPTDPRMLAADRRLAALTASLGGSSSFVGVSM